MESITEEAVRGTARICGEHSGAAQALREAEAKRASGLEVQFFKTRAGIIVASREKTPATDVAASTGAA